MTVNKKFYNRIKKYILRKFLRILNKKRRVSFLFNINECLNYKTCNFKVFILNISIFLEYIAIR
ncbi:hypothetical protein BGI42_07105 [Clostridium taeniosporum]|uniref:Uncharacterized protein n=1 Tax=Clostridium taeniosporum TaxID=394958 RepID=A0A1D7XJL1_9CLOT|nr:hypothetical protein BGI42_07105 [Clostridium taeniosporum]